MADDLLGPRENGREREPRVHTDWWQVAQLMLGHVFI